MGKKNATGEGSLVLLIGPSVPSSRNEILRDERKKNKRYEWIAKIWFHRVFVSVPFLTL